jgi:hypothetical protein
MLVPCFYIPEFVYLAAIVMEEETLQTPATTFEALSLY